MSHPTIDQQVTFLYTRDLATTAHFYEEVMGFELVLDQSICRIYQVSTDGFLGFCKNTGAPETPARIIFTLATSAVDEWYQYLLNKGATIEKPPMHNPDYNIYHCFVRDPNGYLLEIQQFLDPTWPQKSKA